MISAVGTQCAIFWHKNVKKVTSIYPDNSQKIRISILAKTEYKQYSYENYYFFCPEKLPAVQYNVLPVLCIHIYVMALEAVKNTGLSLTGSTWIQLVCVRKSTRLETLHIPHFCCIKRRRRAMRAKHNQNATIRERKHIGHVNQIARLVAILAISYLFLFFFYLLGQILLYSSEIVGVSNYNILNIPFANDKIFEININLKVKYTLVLNFLRYI